MNGGKNASGYPDPTATIAIGRADRERKRKETQMKRNTGGKIYRTTRDQYKAAKKYDREQFDDFCTSVYRSGYKDGESSVPGADIEDVMKAIQTVKGIGEKRLVQIREAVEKVFKNGGKGE